MYGPFTEEREVRKAVALEIATHFKNLPAVKLSDGRTGAIESWRGVDISTAGGTVTVPVKAPPPSSGTYFVVVKVTIPQ